MTQNPQERNGDAILAQEVCHYLTDHMDQRITTAELSARFGVSQTQIKTSFRSLYGASVHAYIRQRKMEEAARLLLESNYSVLEIAGLVGYENGSKFARVFRDLMGMTPSQYRRTKRAEGA